MGIRAKYFLHEYYVWFIMLIVLVAGALTVIFYMRGNDWKIFLTIIAGTVSSIFIMQKQQLDEAKLFKELFVDFNFRYDKLNEELNRIKNEDPKKPLESNDINRLYDYFNLCGEEYLFYRKGYIYPEVWKSWVMGMKIFYDNERIHSVWLKELESGSYYGLNLSMEIKASCKAS